MIGAPQQNWRQIMQMPQQWNAPSGLGFPTQGAMGGWMMPRQMQAPQAPAAQMQAPAQAPSSQPSFMAPMMGKPEINWNAYFSGW